MHVTTMHYLLYNVLADTRRMAKANRIRIYTTSNVKDVHDVIGCRSPCPL